MKKIIGLTGGIGTGKTTLALELSKYCHLNIIELDDLRRYALWKSTEYRHVTLRKELAKLFNLEVKNTFFNREKFTKIIFSSKESLNLYAQCATPILKKDTKIKIDSTENNSIVVWAWLLEEGYYDLVNSFVILINRNINETDNSLKKRQSLEPSYESRLAFREHIEIYEFDNSQNFNLTSFTNLVNKINE